MPTTGAFCTTGTKRTGAAWLTRGTALCHSVLSNRTSFTSNPSRCCCKKINATIYAACFLLFCLMFPGDAIQASRCTIVGLVTTIRTGVALVCSSCGRRCFTHDTIFTLAHAFLWLICSWYTFQTGCCTFVWLIMAFGTGIAFVCSSYDRRCPANDTVFTNVHT